jgi:hypothetical protein
MNQAAATLTSNRSVTADIGYAVDTGTKPVNETFEAGQIIRRRTGETEQRPMHIRDGRPLAAEFSLDRNGFAFVDHKTAVADFFDPAQLETVYYPEVQRLIQAVSGASRVVVFDHTLRTGDLAERETRKIREPVLWAHNDYTEWSGPQRVREILPDEAEQLLRFRFAIIQVWRAINQPIQSNPLALADARSVVAGDLLTAERRYPHRVGETYQLTYNPDHRWYYFPEMTRDEALVFKVYDSAKDGRARFTPHTSFSDPTSPADAPPRQSIEVRTFAFFVQDIRKAG